MIYLICLICWTCQFIQGYPEAKALAHTFQYLYLQKSNRANCCDACTASCNEARERFFSWCSILLLLLLIALAACLTTQCISEFMILYFQVRTYNIYQVYIYIYIYTRHICVYLCCAWLVAEARGGAQGGVCYDSPFARTYDVLTIHIRRTSNQDFPPSQVPDYKQ